MQNAECRMQNVYTRPALHDISCMEGQRKTAPAGAGAVGYGITSNLLVFRQRGCILIEDLENRHVVQVDTLCLEEEVLAIMCV